MKEIVRNIIFYICIIRTLQKNIFSFSSLGESWYNLDMKSKVDIPFNLEPTNKKIRVQVNYYVLGELLRNYEE